jgi:hypothetical protein
MLRERYAMKLPEWMLTNRFVKAELRDDGNYTKLDKRQECSQDDANMVSSVAWDDPVTGQRLHYPCLDLDFDAVLLESSTPGHHHLYLKKLLSEEAYTEVVTVLAKHGILQEGIRRQITEKKETTLRLPHVKKQVEFYESAQVSDSNIQVSDSNIVAGNIVSWTGNLLTYPINAYIAPPVVDKFAEFSEKLKALEEKFGEFQALTAMFLPEGSQGYQTVEFTEFTIPPGSVIIEKTESETNHPEGEQDGQQD